MTKTEYTAYLRSEAWFAIRKACIDLAGGRCRVCNGKQWLHVHHRDYTRVGREMPGDLTVLCSDCHALFHRAGRLPQAFPVERPRRRRDSLGRLMPVTRRRKHV